MKKSDTVAGSAECCTSCAYHRHLIPFSTHLTNEGWNIDLLALQNTLLNEVVALEEIGQVDCRAYSLGILVSEDLCVYERDTKDVVDDENGRLAVPIAGDIGVLSIDLLDGALRGALCEGPNFKTAAE